MFNVPFPPNNNFVGRQDILAEIEATIRKNQEADGCIPTVLKGLGGMGKSQLMLKYCYTHRKEYKYVVWIIANGKLETIQQFHRFARKNGIMFDNEDDLPEKVRMW